MPPTKMPSASASPAASVNKGKGSEAGNGVTHTETTLNAGNNLTIRSGRDTTLTGAQANGEKVTMDVGRNLTLTSEQDSDNYDSKQQNASAGGSVSMGGGGGSVNLSRDKMHSTYDSVQEQTGLFAGAGGFDITVGEHTQLNGAVIGSTAAADKNRLDTGTLGFSNIENRAEYEVEHQSVGISSGGNIGGQFVGNMANGLLVGVNGSGSDSSTTRSAVSEGSLIIRDPNKQTQNVDELSRDVEHANQTLSPIFDKEKEQTRLKEAQLIGEIGTQAMDIARTQGKIIATKAANDKMVTANDADRQTAKAQWEKANPGETPTDKQVNEQVYSNFYNQAFSASGYGTGGKVQQALQAATAAVQGLAGGDLAKAIAGGSAPYLANIIAKTTQDGPERLMAHAVVNAVLAQVQGNSALAGAAGAVTGEMMAGIAKEMYGKPVSELSETEKQTISSLSTLAAGLAGGLTGDTSADAMAGAQAGKNASENNALSLPSGMMDYGQAATSWNQYAVDNNLTPEQTQAGLDKLAKGDLPEGADIAKVIVNGYKDGLLIAGAAYIGPAASIGKVVAGATIAEIANGSYQWFDINQPGNENKTWDYWSSGSAAIMGGLAPGRTVLPNVGIAAGGALFTDGANAGAVGGAVVGGLIGGGVGKYAPNFLDPVLGGSSGLASDVIGAAGSEYFGNKIKDKLNEKK